MSRPTLSTMSSIRPRVFIRIPSAVLSRQPSPVSRAATNDPPNLPSVATRMMSPQTSQSVAPLTSLICVRMPVNAKKIGRNSTTTDVLEPQPELLGEPPVVRQ
jgi:hypothetical protein